MKTPLSKPSFKEEQELWDKGYKFVIGVDEVGRGAFAGPIVAAAVIFAPNSKFKFLKDVNDSKLLNATTRERLSKEIIKNSLWAVESVNIPTINKVGIGKANKMVFRKVINTLASQINEKPYLLADGFPTKYIKKVGLRYQKAIVKGDQKSLTIAAASIVAKVYRDKLMKDANKVYPQFGFSKNKGYGTKRHQKALKTYGICDFHRTSFNLTKFT